MRVLWFTNNSSCYSNNTGGGWISSLEYELRKMDKIHLGICFYAHKDEKVEKEDVTYYLVQRPQKNIKYIFGQISKDKNNASIYHERLAIPPLLKVVKDFKPDIIHVFGSESIFGLISYYTDIPIVLHIQGVLSPYLNAFLPPSISWKNFLFGSINVKQILNNISEKMSWERNCVTERRMMRNLRYLMGRTEWDKRVSEILSPMAYYYHCDEILRDAFYKGGKRILPEKATFVTTISPFLHKGYDVILKTAFILKEFIGIDFEWKVYGDVRNSVVEKKIGIYPRSVNVTLMGRAAAEEIKDAILNATAYVHTAYIENSPNALCEAQLLGCACVATNVGGVCSLVENGKTGLLVPANDIYQLAHQMAYISREHSVNIMMGEASQKVAKLRHGKAKIVERVLEIYQQILENK